MGVLWAVWFLFTLPIRILMWTLSLVGRIAGITIGFSLMVVGMALMASPLFLIGLPLFLVGLFLTLRCLG